MMGRNLAHQTTRRTWRSAAATALTLSLAAPRLASGSTTTAFISNNHSSRMSTPSSMRPAFSTVASGDGDNDSNTNTNDTSRMILPHENGSHNSVKICIPPVSQITDDDPFEKTTFRTRLDQTIVLCRELKKASIWVSVPMSRASWMEDMADIPGLEFHHAAGDTANLMLWLVEDTECKIPEFATHQVGVGAMVVNSRNEILCVRELRKNFMPWKVPGGLSELGEHIDEAIIREVMEETGVPCNFVSVVSFRHTHNLQFGRSDLYFMCRLQPIEEVDEDGNAIIPTPFPQADEIEKAEWVPMEEYKDMISGDDGHPMMSHIVDIYEQGADIERTLLSSVVPGRKPSPVYHYPLNSK